jgi:long-chain acyl-CoA synthetase
MSSAIIPNVPRSLIAESFQRVCRDHRDRVAVRSLSDGSAVTFADLSGQCSAIRRALEEAGVCRGSVVVAHVGNRPIFFPLLAACMDLGTAFVGLGDATDAEAADVIARAGATATVTERGVVRSADGERRSYGEAVVLKMTSGSTDLPKAAIASELHLLNDGRHIIDAIGIGPGDVNLSCIPLSHSYALGNVVMPLLLQGTAVVLRQTFNPMQFSSDVSNGGATVFPGVPFMFERLKAAGLPRLPASMRLLITAGARIEVETVRWFQRNLDRKVHSFYGSSETGGISYDAGDEISDPLHVGRAMPETTIAVLPSDGTAEAGRVFVRGNAVAHGYADATADASISKFCDEGFLTGDLGRFDEAGRLILTGRVSTAVNVAGRKVDPSEVERALLAVPGVGDARVLGVACDVRGQQVVAFVVRKDAALTSLAIRQYCAATLSAYKIPRRFVFLDRLPVDARGKVDRRALQSLAARADTL